MTTVSPTVITKFPAESFVVTFDFASLLATGEKISTAAITAELFFGVDASPSGVLSGSAQVESLAQKTVLQRIANGLAGCIYRLVCNATTDASNIYTLVGMLELNG